MIGAERDTPFLDGPLADSITESLNEATQNAMPDNTMWEESIENRRNGAENLITAWQESISNDPDVIFLPVSAVYSLESLLHVCAIRADNDPDPFTLPDTFADAVAFVKQLQEAENTKEPVIVHQTNSPISRKDTRHRASLFSSTSRVPFRFIRAAEITSICRPSL